MLFHLVLTFALAAPDHTAELRAALALEDRGDPIAAARAVEALVAKAPAWDLARIEAGRLWLAQGQIDRAEGQLDAARSLAPENPRAHFLWGLVMDERRQTDEAVRALETALLLRDDYQEARFRLAGLYVAQRDYEKASAAWKQYSDAHPAELGPKLQWASALELSGHKPEAEKELKKLYLDPKTKDLVGRKLAEFYDRQGKAADAARVRRETAGKGRKLRDLLPSHH